MGRVGADDRPLIEAAVERSRGAALMFITDGVVTTMNRVNKKG